MQLTKELRVQIATWLILFLALNIVFTAAATEQRSVSILYAADMPIIGFHQGNYAQLSSAVSQHREQNQHSVFLFGGNSLGPSPMSAFDNGSHIIDLLNSIEPDAMAVTKREFSYFEEQLSLRAFEAAFPLIASNIVVETDQSLQDGLVESLRIEKNGISIAILAVVDPRAKQHYLLRRAEVKDIATTLFHQSKQLKQQGVDVVIVMHGTEFPEIDNLINRGIIDVSLVKDPFAPDEAIEKAQNMRHKVLLNKLGDVAEIKLTLNQDNEVALQWQRKSLNDFVEEPFLAKQEQDYTRRLERLMNQPIATVKHDFSTFRSSVRTEENGFGNLIADTLIEFTGADIAVVNSGGIRGDRQYKAGDVFTRQDLIDELPFQTGIVLIELLGKDILQTLEDCVSEVEFNRGRFPQVGNLNFTFDSVEPAGSRIKKVLINGSPLQPEQRYTVATTNYLYNGGDGYKHFAKAQRLPTSYSGDVMLSDLLLNALLSKRELSVAVEGRISNLSSVTSTSQSHSK